MKNPNKLFAVIFFIVTGCATTPTCPFDKSNVIKDTSDDCEALTITAYLPPVVVNLDYKDVRGSKSQVIVQGGFQHVISVPGEKVIAEIPPQSTVIPLSVIPDKVASETETVLFEFDHSVIPVSELDKLSNFMRRVNSSDLLHIQIEGHTDSKGAAKYNKALSLKRARAVSYYLIQHGIKPSKITTKGFGEDFPLEPNDSDDNRAKNRRVILTPTKSK
jgi:outer membrane protein OmpA-like peptidoglycan-associated protein